MRKMMVYRVNVDKPTGSAKIHRGDCRYGVPRYKKPKNGRWYSFSTVAEARGAAPNASGCKVCNP